MNIGTLRLAAPVLLAPMSGITDFPFRRAVARHGVGLLVTEMIASAAAVQQARDYRLKARRDFSEERPLAVQLAGVEPEIMAEAARLCEGRGAAAIDLNFGCPARNVTKKAAGSALMRDERLAARIFEAVVGAVSVPVTLKMRTGWDEASRNAPALAGIAEACGIAMITVHGRTRCQFFEGRADWAFVRQVKQATRLPVVVNGDIRSVADAREALCQSGADGVMVGRGCYGRPWLPAQIAAALAGEPEPAEPASNQLGEQIIEHYRDILGDAGIEAGVRMARKHLGWYAGDRPGADAYRTRVNRLEDPRAVEAATRDFYARSAERLAA